MASAFHLHGLFDITLYEQNNYVGGHTNSVEVLEDGRPLRIDTGFIVYNEVTYPNLTALFRELNVQTQPAPMSFSVQHVPSGLEFCGSGWLGLFAQRRNAVNPRFWRLLREIARFNAQSPAILDDPRYAHHTLEGYAAEMGFHKDLLEKYLLPMSSAVWSTPAESMLRFPAVTLVRFFQNHGFLGLHTQHAWRTVTGSSRQYRDKIIAPFRDRIHVERAAAQVEESASQAQVRDASGKTDHYDFVLVATHADQALRLLARPSGRQAGLLGAFAYQTNRALLHTDETVMPRGRRSWSSWNGWTGTDAEGCTRTSTTYWMNKLQGIRSRKNYFLSLNDAGRVRPEHRLREILYEHPVFSVEAMQVQKDLPSINGPGRVYFCGSYFRYGFHEDALVSALAAIEGLRAKAA